MICDLITYIFAVFLVGEWWQILELVFKMYVVWYTLTALSYFGLYLAYNKLEKYKEVWWVKIPLMICVFIFVVLLDFPLQVLSSWQGLPKEWLYTHRMKRYKKLAIDHMTKAERFKITFGGYRFSFKLNFWNKMQYNIAIWTCTQLNRNGQVKDHC
ncbi:MAG: hypothetical protein BMS9Abin31_0478 [Gammaproteobacteria bacterium]|nr:MAG: hypothetical protein BMS9Abin31_0478 [Gammaproteobacteria bacterium]